MMTEAKFQHLYLSAHGLPQGAILPYASYIQGWQVAFDCVPDILYLVLLTYIRKHFSRRSMLVLNWGGTILAEGWILFVGWSGLPLPWTWCSSLFRLFGGDSRTTIALILSLLSDMTASSDRHSFTFPITTTLLAAEFAGSAIATLALSYSAYVSLLLGLIIPIVTLPLAFLIPSDERPLNPRQRTADKDTEQHELSTWATSCLKQLRKPKIPSRSDLRISWLVATCLISRIGRYPFSLLLPTVSHRYQGTMAETGFLLCFKAVVSLMGLAILMRCIRPLLLRRQSPTHSADATPLFGPYRLDLWTMRGSAVCMAIGAVLLSASRSLTIVYTGVVLYALGIGFGGGVGGLIAQLTGSEGVLLPDNMLEAVFDAIAAPVMSYTCLFGAQLDESMSMGGLPFVAAASIFGLIAIGTFF